MLELNDDGDLRFRTVVVLVARQNGKSTLAQVLTIWLMCVWQWPLILGTAQDLDVAEEIWSDVVDLVQGNAELSELVDRVVKVNGKKALELTTGQRYKVKAANAKAGRGLSGNLVLLDELRTHQNWNAWAAITKTTLARAEALILCLSNAGGVEAVVLRYLRLAAHRVLGDPDGICAEEDGSDGGPVQFDLDGIDLADAIGDEDDDEFDVELDDVELDDMRVDDDSLALFEWSATPGCDKRDRDEWARANPSLGYTELSERNIASALREPDHVFRVEVLCQWVDGAGGGPFPPGSWAEGKITLVEDADGKLSVAPADKIVGKVVAGVDQMDDRSHTVVAFAGRRADGKAQVEIVTARHGSGWLAGWLTSPDRRGRITAVTGQSNGAPISPTLKRLSEDPSFHIPVVPLAGSDLLDAHAVTFDAVRDVEVMHPPRAPLDIAAGSAETKIMGAGAWVIDRRSSPTDVAPLMAFIAAYWLLTRYVRPPLPPPPPPAAINADPGDHDDGGGDLTSDLATVGF